jgi:hypothetical protein
MQRTISRGASARCAGTSCHASAFHDPMLTPAEEAARQQLNMAEAELAVLKQELVLQHLIDTREPSEEARLKLARLRQIAQKLTDGSGREEQTNKQAA